MVLHPILELFRKLLELCRRQASHGLVWLFKLFSFLTKQSGGRRSAPTSKRELKEETSELREVRGGGGGGVGTSSGVKHIPSSPFPSTERSVVLACSSQPVTPPRARTRENARSWSSIGSVTSTLYDSPSSENGGYELGAVCSSPTQLSLKPLGSIKEEDGQRESIYMENAELSAEPTGMVASPTTEKHPRMKPVAPSDRPRYDREIVIKNHVKRFTFSPLSTFNVFRPFNVRSKEFTGAWQHYVHPEGVPYYHLERDSSGLSFLTEADLTVGEVLEEVENFARELEGRLETEVVQRERCRPERLEIVLELQDGWSYYMVDLDKEVVFWLDEYTMSPLGENYGVEHEDNFRPQLVFEFWIHIENFPNHRVFRREQFVEALGILGFWRVDVITSADSTAPYEPQEIDSLIKSVHLLQGTMGPGTCNPYAVAVVARVMTVAANERLLNFYGSPGARLQVWQSVRGEPKRERQWLVKYLSPLLFYAPETHLSGLEKQWVDGVIQERRWKKYQLKLERDWESFVLTSTVLLNANVALLTTPIVLARDDGVLFASPAAAASQVSIVASIASIIIGLLLIRQIRISSKDIDINATDAINYLSTRKHPRLGLETMAIHYSLPYALLMWGIVTFLTSIAIASFYKADGWPSTASQVIYACTWLFIVPLILWTIITGWETNHRAHWTDLFSRERLMSFVRLQWEKPVFGRGWAFPGRRRYKPDVEARESDDKSVDNEAAPETPTNESTTAIDLKEGGDWRVRVKNFGPVRRLTWALTRS